MTSMPPAPAAELRGDRGAEPRPRSPTPAVEVEAAHSPGTSTASRQRGHTRSSTCAPTCNSTNAYIPGAGLQPGRTRRGSAPSSPGSPTATASVFCPLATTPTRPHRGAPCPPPVGIRNVAGYLAGGMTSWRERSDRPGRSSGSTSRRCTRSVDQVRVLDVRERSVAGPGPYPRGISHAVPRHRRDPRPSRPSRRSRSSAPQASEARSPRRRRVRHGAQHLMHVADGGVGTWEKYGWPIER